MMKELLAEQRLPSEAETVSSSPTEVLNKVARLLPAALARADLTMTQEKSLIDRLSRILEEINVHSTAEPIGCCVFKANGATMERNTTKAECDTLHGTWSPHPCG
jgi:hypothetical protein